MASDTTDALAPPEHSRRVILDMDYGIDDSMATLYLVASGLVDIVAVGTVHGNTDARQAALNGAQVLRAAGLPGVPIAVGAVRPMSQELHLAAEVHGDDGLGGQSDGARAGSPITAESAAEQLVRLARSAPGEFTLLATGPLTNVALALLLEPALPTLLRSVVVMGGALRAAGNITPVAEANIWHDPEAADLVFSAMQNLVLVPVDLTHEVWVGSEQLDRISAGPSAPLADLVRAMLPQYLEFSLSATGRRGFPVHDPTAAVLLCHPGGATYERHEIAVETAGLRARGQLVVDRRDKPVASGRPLVQVAVRERVSIVEEFVSRAFGGGSV